MTVKLNPVLICTLHHARGGYLLSTVFCSGFHVVFIPKCHRKVLYGQLRRNLGEVFHQLAKQKESRIEEGHLMSDHVHMMIAIPPK